MAEPPTESTKKFKPVGRLQLNRLSEQAGFRCAGCLTDKVANFVATKGGDWAQTLCDECYASLVNGSRPTVYTAPRPVRPKIPQLQQSQKLKSKKAASKSARSVAEKKRRHFE